MQTQPALQAWTWASSWRNTTAESHQQPRPLAAHHIPSPLPLRQNRRLHSLPNKLLMSFRPLPALLRCTKSSMLSPTHPLVNDIVCTHPKPPAARVDACTLSHVCSLWPHRLYPARFPSPWNFPGKNTGVGCHFLLQGIFMTQGSKSCLLPWQAASLPLSHLRSPAHPWSHLFLKRAEATHSQKA